MGDGAVRETSEAKALAPSAHIESQIRPSLEDMQASRSLFQPRESAPHAIPGVIDFGNHANLYGDDIIAQLPQNKPEYERGDDGRWHFENPRAHGNDIAGKLKEWLWNDAPNLPGDIAKPLINAVWDGTVAASEMVNRHFAMNHIPDGAAMEFLSGIVKKPDMYQQRYREINAIACWDAHRAFGLDALGIDSKLIPAIILNEQLHRKGIWDDGQDLAARVGIHQKPGESIGPAQMQIQNIETLAAQYPQLERLGDPLKSALDPAKAPYYVAAYLLREATKIEQYNEEHAQDANFKPIPINTDTLAYMYNPDVYRDQQGNLRSLEPWEKVAADVKLLHGARKEKFPVPGVIEHSHHLQKVHQAMQEVSEGI